MFNLRKWITLSVLITFIVIGSSKLTFAKDDYHPHHIAVFNGATYFDYKSKTYFTSGIDYEFRFHKMFGVMVLADFVFADNIITILGGGVVFHPWAGLKFIAAPGVEMVSGENNHFLIRGGVGYDIHLGDMFSITPIFNLDYSNSHFAEVFGVAFGIGF